MIHTCEIDIRKPVPLFVVGCGGTGCAVGAGLPYLHQALLARGGGGLAVTFIDGDRVSATNCVRQPFAPEEIGLYKATLLASRLNTMWRTRWHAIPQFVTDRFRALENMSQAQAFRAGIVIGCVDKRTARQAIAALAKNGQCRYWLDFGNDAETGQYLLGQPADVSSRQTLMLGDGCVSAMRGTAMHIYKRQTRIPLPSDLYPALVRAELDGPETPSCTSLEALERQQPFVNQTLAALGLNLLSQLLWGGQISYHGAFVNLKSGQLRHLPIDPEAWKQIGRHQKKALRMSA